MENKKLPEPKYMFNYLITNKKDKKDKILNKNNKKRQKKEYLDDLLDYKFLNNYFSRN